MAGLSFGACVPMLEVVDTVTPGDATDLVTPTDTPPNDVQGDLVVRDVQQGAVQLRITAPATGASVRNTVTVRLATVGTGTATVTLLLDGTLLASLSPPTTDYSWDTSSVAEGSHELLAQATVNGTLYSSDPVTVTVDRTAPSIVSRVPMPNAMNVFVGDPVRITFSEPMLASTLDDATVTLTQNATNVDKDISLSADGTVLTLRPRSTLMAPGQVEALLDAANITDRAGNALRVTGTGMWSWSLPEWAPIARNLLLNSGTFAVQPRVVVDLDGNVIATWTEAKLDPPQVHLHIAKYMDGAWQPMEAGLPTELSRTPFLGIPSLDPSGVLHLAVAFGDRSDPDAGLFNDPTVAGIFQWNGSAWQQLGNDITALAGSSPSFGQASFSAQTTVARPIFAYQDSNNRTSASVWRYDGTTWTELPPVGMVSGDIDNFVAATTMTGEVYAAWTEYPSTIRVRRYDGTGWLALDGDALDLTVGQPSNATSTNLSKSRPVLAPSRLEPGAMFVAGIGGDGTTVFGDAFLWQYNPSTPTGYYREVMGPLQLYPESNTYISQVALLMTGLDIPFMAFRERTADGMGQSLAVFTRSVSSPTQIGSSLTVNTTGDIFSNYDFALAPRNAPVVAYISQLTAGGDVGLWVYRYNQ